MGDFVNTNPQSEIPGIGLQLSFGRDDIGRHEREPPEAGLAVHVGRQEKLVLAEHLAGKVRQQHTHLHARHPRADRRHQRAAHRLRALRREFVEQRRHHDFEAADVAFYPAGAVDDRRRFVLVWSTHPGDRDNVVFGVDRQLA